LKKDLEKQDLGNLDDSLSKKDLENLGDDSL
jgi:hypothetical protein